MSKRQVVTDAMTSPISRRKRTIVRDAVADAATDAVADAATDAVADAAAADAVKSRRKPVKNKNEDAVKSRRKNNSPKKASPLRLSPQERHTLSEVVHRANANETEYPSDLPELGLASPYVSPVLPVPNVASPLRSEDLPKVASPLRSEDLPDRVLTNSPSINSLSEIQPFMSSESSESESDFTPMNIEIGKEYNMKRIDLENMVTGEKYVLNRMNEYWLIEVLNIEIQESHLNFEPERIRIIFTFHAKRCSVILNNNKLVFDRETDNEQEVGSYITHKNLDLHFLTIGNVSYGSYSSAIVFSFDDEIEMPSRKLNDMNIKKYTTMYCSGQLSRLPKNLKDDIGKWDLNNVSDMSYLFINCIPDPKIKSWDVKHVVNMSYAFSFVKDHPSPWVGIVEHRDISLDLSQWDVSNVTDMKCMFMNCYVKINAIFSNTKNVRTMEYMFMGLTNLNKKLSLKNMEVNNVHNFKGMFAKTGIIKDIFKITGNSATNMSCMFYNSPFNSHVLQFNTENVTDMSHMFELSKYNKPINFNTKNVTNMSFMFSSNTKYNRDLNFDTRNVVNMLAMFRSSVFNSNINFTTTENVTNMESMFEHSIYNKPLNFDTRNVTTMKQMFGNAIHFNSAINFTDTSNVENMHSMFKLAVTFNQPINFNTERVTTMEQMFLGARVFNQPIHFNTRQVTNMDSMFKSAAAFNQNLNFDVQNVIEFGEMFANTFALRGEINFINVQEHVGIVRMFHNSRLVEIGRVPQIFRNIQVLPPPRQPVDAMQIHAEFNSVDSDQIPIVMYPLTGHDTAYYRNYRTNWNSFIAMVSERFEQTLNNIPVSNANERTNVDAVSQRDKDLFLQTLRLIIRKLFMSRDISVFAPLCAPFVDYMFLDKNREMQQSYVINYIKYNATAYEDDLAQANIGNLSCAQGIMERFILEARELLVSIDTPEAQRIVKLIFNTGILPVQQYFADWARDNLYNTDYVKQLPGDPNASESKKADINKQRLKFVKDNFINDAKAYYHTNDSLNRKTLKQINNFANTIDMSAMEMADLLLGGGRSRRRIRRNRKNSSRRRKSFR